MEMTVLYQDEYGNYIVSVSENVTYYGNGEDMNAIGKTANQFLRFHPYMEYVGDKGIKPNEKITQWIEQNANS